ncbi:MAG: helix-turn-helix domain-containing protein [Myxococcales bacterium]|nr:helix-turn-helix domain-containing protein [Myxococcales bacterium]
MAPSAPAPVPRGDRRHRRAHARRRGHAARRAAEPPRHRGALAFVERAARLPARLRAVAALCLRDGATLDETAARLGIARETVRVHLRRLRALQRRRRPSAALIGGAGAVLGRRGPCSRGVVTQWVSAGQRSRADARTVVTHWVRARAQGRDWTQARLPTG